MVHVHDGYFHNEYNPKNEPRMNLNCTPIQGRPRAGYTLMSLPNGGYDGPVPDFPLGRYRVMEVVEKGVARYSEKETRAFRRRELAMWKAVWKYPQAWARSIPQYSYMVFDVALYCRSMAIAEFLAQRRRERFARKMERLSHKSEPVETVEKPSEDVEWPVNVQPPTENVVSHILHGEGDGKRGGHLYGTGVPGKTEFPRGWDGTRIIRAMRHVMTEPDWTRPAKDERALHQFGRTVDGVQIEVKAYKVDEKYVIDQAYPVGGKGVTRNTPDGKIDVKFSKSKQWKKVTPP